MAPALTIGDLVFMAASLGIAFTAYRVGLRRSAASPSQVATLVFALASWGVLFWVQKVVSWQLWGGRGFAHGYGGDKAMTNFLLEPLLVAVSVAGVGVLASRLLGVRYSSRAAVAIAVAVSAAVVLLVPAIPD